MQTFIQRGLLLLVHGGLIVVLFAQGVSAPGQLHQKEQKHNQKSTGNFPKKAPQQDEDPAQPAKLAPITFWDNEGLQYEAALAVFGAAPPFGTLGARVLASESQLEGWVFTFDHVIPLDRTDLERIRDKRRLPDVRSKPFSELQLPDRAFYRIFIEALWRSELASLEMFKNSAEEYKRVQYVDLFNHPNRYRGKIITVKGKITLLRESDPPRHLPIRPNLNVRKIYNTWIVVPQKGVPPFTAVFTELPKDLEPSPKLDAEVTFQGYFLGIINIPAEKEHGATKKDLLTPYLVGKTLLVDSLKPPPPTVVPQSYSGQLIVTVLAGVVGIVVLGAIMNVWFRRGDQRIHSQLQEVRDRHQPFQIEPDLPPAPAVMADSELPPPPQPEQAMNTKEPSEPLPQPRDEVVQLPKPASLPPPPGP